MKTLKVLILLLFFICGINFILYAQEGSRWIDIKLERCPIKEKDKGGNTDKGEVPRKRSIPIQFAYAYIYNYIVNINFTESFSNTSLTIISEKDNKTVYSEIGNNLNCTIDLGNENKGNYLIKIEVDDISLVGKFTLQLSSIYDI